jgi:hypothetical protein
MSWRRARTWGCWKGGHRRGGAAQWFRPPQAEQRVEPKAKPIPNETTVDTGSISQTFSSRDDATNDNAGLPDTLPSAGTGNATQVGGTLYNAPTVPDYWLMENSTVDWTAGAARKRLDTRPYRFLTLPTH